MKKIKKAKTNALKTKMSRRPHLTEKDYTDRKVWNEDRNTEESAR